LVLAIVVFFTVIKRHANVGLPQTIEEYRVALQQPDFGMFFLDYSRALQAPTDFTDIENVKLHLYEMLGARSASMGSTENVGNLVANYSAVVRKRVSFGRRWREVTNAVSYDDSKPRTRRETLQMIEGILRTNGGFILPLNGTNVVLLTEKDLNDLRHPVPLH
jgi:hypothetical protein